MVALLGHHVPQVSEFRLPVLVHFLASLDAGKHREESKMWESVTGA